MRTNPFVKKTPEWLLLCPVNLEFPLDNLYPVIMCHHLVGVPESRDSVYIYMKVRTIHHVRNES